MSIGGLDLGYWKGGGYWAEQWRPDGFFQLPAEDQQRITKQVEAAKGDWMLACRLTEAALKSHESSQDA